MATVLLKSTFVNSSNLLPSSLIKISTRNTYVLKRKFPLPLRKRLNQDPPELEDRVHNLYEVHDHITTSTYPGKYIDVILTQFVEDVGKRGQVVNLHPHTAYNEYLLPGLAVYATPENLERQKALSEADLDKYSTVSAYTTMKALKKTVVSVFMNMNAEWTIEPWHVRIALRRQGIHVLKDDSIQLSETPITGPNLALEGKDFVATIIINNMEKVAVRCRLRHWSPKFIDRIPLPPNHFCVPSEAILPEEAEILASIPLPEYKEVEKKVEKKKSRRK